MTRGPSELAYLARFRPGEAVARILEAYQATGGNAVHAARRLGVTHRTTLRIVKELNLREQIREQIERIRVAARADRERLKRAKGEG